MKSDKKINIFPGKLFIVVIVVIVLFVLILSFLYHTSGFVLSGYDTNIPKDTIVTFEKNDLVILKSFDQILNNRQLGILKHQFGSDVPIQSLLFELGSVRFIVGKVDDSVTGKLAFVDFERVELNSRDWMKAIKTSTIKNRLFIIPIFKTEFEQWKRLISISIQTDESLKEGTGSLKKSGDVWEKKFTSPVPLEMLFIKVN